MSARFSYIDDEGREVEIGGSAQLLEQIREGTIDGSTQLFDAASDRWSPAAEHPVFRELAATFGGEGEPMAEASSPAEEPGTDEAGEAASGLTGAGAKEEAGFEEMDFGLTLSGGEAEAVSDVEAGEEEGAADFGLGDFTLASGEEEGEGTTEEAGEEEEEKEEEASFDFGSEPLALVAEPEEEEEEEEEEAEREAGAGGMALESPLDHLSVEAPGAGGFESGTLVPGAAGESWSRSGDPDEWNDPTELETEAEEEAPTERTRAPAKPRAGEAPPKRAQPERPPAEQPRTVSVLMLLVVVAILAGGGWAGYTFFLAGSGEPVEVAGPGPDPRTLRTVPADLRGPMVAVADDAMSDVADWIRSLGRSHELPERPPREWLDGIYLAHASRYPGVEAFFSAVGALLADVRSEAPTRFERAYDGALAGTDLTEDQKAQLRAWLQEDMTWSAARRDTVYDAMAEIVDAALGLHALLVERESDIGYQLMEAVPSDPALQEAIDRHLDRITGSLDTLDALGQVTAARFEEVLVANLRRTLVPPEPASSGGAG